MDFLHVFCPSNKASKNYSMQMNKPYKDGEIFLVVVLEGKQVSMWLLLDVIIEAGANGRDAERSFE